MGTKPTLSGIMLFLLAFNLQVSGQTDVEYFPGEIFIKYKDNISTRSFIPSVYDKVQIEDVPQVYAVKNKYQITGVRKPFYLAEDNIKLQNTYQVKFTDYDRIDELIAELQADPAIEYAEKLPVIELDGEVVQGKNGVTYTPNDPQYSNQWHLSHINCPQAWELVKGDPNIIVAIVDNEIEWEHVDFKMWDNPGETPGNGVDDDNNGFVDDMVGWDFTGGDNDPSASSTSGAHGTHVAGCAAAQTGNGKVVASPAYNVTILACKIGTGGTGLSPSAGIEAWLYAANHGAKVISNSWGSGSNLGQTGQNVVHQVRSMGATLFASAGNGGDGSIRYPCAYDGIICVSNLGSNDVKASSSQYHSTVDMAGPGVQILSTFIDSDLGPSSNTASLTGTSMSTPVVAGVAALMLSANPELTPDEVEDCMKSTAVDIYQISSNQPYEGKLGAGRVDALAAVECALEKLSAPPVAGFSSDVTQGCGSLTVQFTDESRLSPESWLWDFGDGSTSAQQNPVHTYDSPDAYTVTLKVTNTNGEDQVQQTDMITVGNGQTYPGINGGPKDNSMGTGASFTANDLRGLFFNVHDDVVIESLFVYSGSEGTRTIEVLSDAAATGQNGEVTGTSLVSKEILIPAGNTRVEVNLEIPAGNNYFIKVRGALIDLYRNDTGPNYPYNIADNLGNTLVDITQSNAGSDATAYYYYFYDWKVRKAGCQVGTGIADKTDLNIIVYPNPVKEVFNIELKGERPESAKIKLYNLIGEVVYEKDFGTVSGNGQYQVSFSGLASGSYLLYVNAGDKVFSQKIIKE